ncbi:MAG: LamG domain-containing protein [Ruminococcaceae bacterium]|nr:LamG domain-containing protein [Oscillospiraceae bacterium]
MKKILALALCALMMASAVISISAAEKTPFLYDFEKDPTGDFITVDKTIQKVNKGFPMEVTKVGDTNALKFDRMNYDKNKHSGADPYIGIFEGGIKSYGVKDRFVLAYDFYLEKEDSVKNADGTYASQAMFQLGMLRMTPAGASTQFLHPFRLVGKDIRKGGSETGDVLATLKLKTWYNLAIVYDFNAKTCSAYLNGDTLYENAKWEDLGISVTTATDATQLRLGWNGSGDNTYNAVAYVDNIRVYNADKPDNATGKVYGAAAPETKPAAPATPATPAAPTADIAVVLAAVSAVAASGAIVFKKRK